MQIVVLAGHMKQLALSGSESVAVKERSCEVLGCMAERYPHIAEEDVLPSLLQSFTPDAGMLIAPPLLVADEWVPGPIPSAAQPMETDQMESKSEAAALPDLSRVLVSLSMNPDLQELTLPAFVAVLEQLAETPFTPELVETAEAVAGHLCRLVEKTVTQSGLGVQFVHKMVAKEILLLCILPSVARSSAGPLFTEKAVLKQCLSLLRTFTLAANKTTECAIYCAMCIRHFYLSR